MNAETFRARAEAWLLLCARVELEEQRERALHNILQELRDKRTHAGKSMTDSLGDYESARAIVIEGNGVVVIRSGGEVELIPTPD